MKHERRRCEEQTTASAWTERCSQPATRTCSCAKRLCQAHIRYHARNFKHSEIRELRSSR